ncbi:5' exonuclease Apollo-like [Chenopodium quinoa]|uniref:Protein artemis n=1 Tax=Chenopodium quinoa TaxID=63459 RepID=A0A803M8C7_CHEQI|nr:5' exonuclease Apollo-like [Chenopodium quinoa]
MEGGMISVDRWARGSQAYFLTHLHSDHTRGLSSTWSHGPLFCSRTTAKLFPLKFPDFKFALLRVVEIGSWHHLSLSSPSSGSPAPIHFMPIDAFHCPGAVMFLFKGIFGHVLYTGDFRWEATGERSMKARNMLLDALHGAKVDHLYLDNTYCNPLYCFPTREVAAQQVIEIIASHPDHDIIIGIDSLGKEDLLLQISRSLKIKIWVWPERLQTMHLLGYPDIFTTRTSLTRVRAVPRYSFSMNTLEALNAKRPTIGIMPSGLPWVVKPFEGKMKDSLTLSVASTNRTLAGNGTRVDRNMKSAEKVHDHIFTVPYSDHCCFHEIKDFVQLTKPYNVKGIVSMSFCYVNPAYYLSHLFSSNHSSQKTRLDPEILMEVEKVERKGKMKIRDIRGTGLKKRTNKANFMGVRIRRVAILRQISRGVKIVECDSPD